MRTEIRTLIYAFLLCAAPTFAQKQTPPEGRTPREFTLPARTSFTLNNGLMATLVPYGAIPKVQVRVVVRCGRINEGPDEVWLSELTGELMKEGTATRSAKQVAEEAAGMGGSIAISVGDDQTSISGDVLSEFAPGLVALLADVIRNPLLPESELARLKNDQLRTLSISRSDPNALTSEKFRALMFPDHPYGRMYPTEKMISGFTLEQVRRFHAENFGAARTHVYVVGKFEMKNVEDAIKKGFGDYPHGTDPVVRIPTPVSKREIHIVERPGAPQSTISLGLPTIDPSHPEYRPLLVMNALLGGSFSSRITSNIREDKGYTYSPGSTISSRYRNAFWMQFASVTTNVTGPSLKEIFYEINRLREEAPSVEELRDIQNYLAGVFVLQNSSIGGIINQLVFMNLHGLPDTYLTEYVGAIHAVTPEQVRDLARKYIRPEEIRIVITGDKRTITQQASAYGRIVP